MQIDGYCELRTSCSGVTAIKLNPSLSVFRLYFSDKPCAHPGVHSSTDLLIGSSRKNAFCKCTMTSLKRCGGILTNSIFNVNDSAVKFWVKNCLSVQVLWFAYLKLYKRSVYDIEWWWQRSACVDSPTFLHDELLCWVITIIGSSISVNKLNLAKHEIGEWSVDVEQIELECAWCRISGMEINL